MTADPPALPSATPPATRRWGLRLLIAAALLLGVVWAAPIVLGYSPAVAWVCGHAADYIDGSVTVGSASLGWFSPVVLHNVQVRDADHRPVIHVPRIDTDRTLLGLLLDRTDLGKLRLERPKIEWNFQGNDSNLERILAKPRDERSDSRGSDPRESLRSSRGLLTLPHVHLEIVDGTVAIFDNDTKLFWKAHGLAFSAIVFNDPARTVQVNVHGSLHDGGETGSLKAEMQIQNTSANPKATIKGRFSCFPLAVTNVFVRRYLPGAALAGSLQGHCLMSATLKDGKPVVDFVGEVTANQLHVNAPFLADQFYLERLNVPCRLVLDHRKLTVERAELEGDFGKATVQGAFDLERTGLAAFDRPDFDFSANINLAVLAERLPKTLHLQRDIRINTGQLSLACKSVAKGDAVVWQGHLRTTDVRGIKGQQLIAWADPVRFEFKVRNLTKGVPLIDELKCTARFLKLDASATPEQFTLTAEADLNHLVEPLSQFIDIDALKLTGRANAGVVVRRTEGERFNLQGNVQLKQVNLTWFTKQPWREDSLVANLNATGRLDGDGTQTIESANFEAKLGSDRVVVGLKDVIPDLAAGPWGTLGVRVEGDLTRWQHRAHGWTTLLDPWFFEGQANLALNLRPSLQAIECSSADLHASSFRCTGPGLWINEPTLHVTSAGRWDARTGRVDLGLTKLACPTAQIEANQLSFDPTTMALQTTAHVTGDVGQLRKWTQDPKARTSEPIEGALVARFEVQTSGQRLASAFDVTVKDLVYGPRANPTWREAAVKCNGRGNYDLAKDVFHLDTIHLSGATLSADLKGTIANLTTTTDVDLQGTLAYDLEKMEPQLRTYLGKDVKVAGKDARAFHIAGPLYPKGIAKTLTPLSGTEGRQMRFTELKGQAGFEWKTLKAFGCDVGPAEVRAVLQQGWFQLYPIETSLNGGKLRLQPNLRLDPEPTEVVLLAGPVVENAKITPTMCAGALGYVMPLLANVAEADGAISLSLEGGRIPLAAPTTGELKGKFVLHAAKVGPGPMIRELSSLLKIPPPTSLVKECQVPFHMISGKVHHRDLELAFPEFTLKSSGAVGLDGTLAIVIEMPIPARLIAGAKLTPAQAKQMLRIPIGGTLERPRPDPRALESLGAILGRSILENQLNKLLQPKR